MWSILSTVSENAPKHSTVDLKFSNWAWSVCVEFGLVQFRNMRFGSKLDYNTLPHFNGVDIYKSTPIPPIPRLVWFVIQGWYRMYCRLTFICGNEGKRIPCSCRGRGYERQS